MRGCVGAWVRWCVGAYLSCGQLLRIDPQPRLEMRKPVHVPVALPVNMGVWRGAVWHGAAWHGVARHGAAWRGEVWRGAAWRGAPNVDELDGKVLLLL